MPPFTQTNYEALKMKFAWIFLALVLAGCNSSSNDGSTTDTEQTSEKAVADITEVTAQGDAGNYTFYVTIASDETGCKQYADWWEVLSNDGQLIHRRILAHSHPTDQPFTRASSPVNIQAEDTVYIRAHMNKDGYTGAVFKGSVVSGFLKATTIPNFSDEIAAQQPLPSGCAF